MLNPMTVCFLDIGNFRQKMWIKVSWIFHSNVTNPLTSNLQPVQVCLRNYCHISKMAVRPYNMIQKAGSAALKYDTEGRPQWHMIMWLWNDYCNVDSESLPILIICLKHSKTIEILSLSDISKIFIFEDMQIQFHCVYICRYPMLTR